MDDYLRVLAQKTSDDEKKQKALHRFLESQEMRQKEQEMMQAKLEQERASRNAGSEGRDEGMSTRVSC